MGVKLCITTILTPTLTLRAGENVGYARHSSNAGHP